jgi:hypothetical protein
MLDQIRPNLVFHRIELEDLNFTFVFYLFASNSNKTQDPPGVVLFHANGLAYRTWDTPYASIPDLSDALE